MCLLGFFPGSPASYHCPKSCTGGYGGLVFPKIKLDNSTMSEKISSKRVHWSLVIWPEEQVLVEPRGKVSRWPRIENLPHTEFGIGWTLVWLVVVYLQEGSGFRLNPSGWLLRSVIPAWHLDRTRTSSRRDPAANQCVGGGGWVPFV